MDRHKVEHLRIEKIWTWLDMLGAQDHESKTCWTTQLSWCSKETAGMMPDALQHEKKRIIISTHPIEVCSMLPFTTGWLSWQKWYKSWKITMFDWISSCQDCFDNFFRHRATVDRFCFHTAWWEIERVEDGHGQPPPGAHSEHPPTSVPLCWDTILKK